MSEPLANPVSVKEPVGKRAWRQRNVLPAQSHRSAKTFDGFLLWEFRNHRGAGFGKFRTVGVTESGLISSKFDDCHLEAKTDA